VQVIPLLFPVTEIVGSWAADVAKEFPATKLIGMYISPILYLKETRKIWRLCFWINGYIQEFETEKGRKEFAGALVAEMCNVDYHIYFTM
jgi:hypothetical protein